jgi:hypothetical protein
VFVLKTGVLTWFAGLGQPLDGLADRPGRAGF